MHLRPVENKEKRDKLLEIVKNNLPKNTGAILRTASENATVPPIIGYYLFKLNLSFQRE